MLIETAKILQLSKDLPNNCTCYTLTQGKKKGQHHPFATKILNICAYCFYSFLSQAPCPSSYSFQPIQFMKCSSCIFVSCSLVTLLNTASHLCWPDLYAWLFFFFFFTIPEATIRPGCNQDILFLNILKNISVLFSEQNKSNCIYLTK